MKETLKNQKGIDTMEKIKTPTRKEMFTRVSDFLAQYGADTEMIDFINHQIELLSRKKPTGEGGLTKEQEENLACTEAIFEQMETGRKYGVAELMKELPMVAEWNSSHDKEMTSQKFASLIKPLIEDGRIEKITEKRKVYYTKH